MPKILEHPTHKEKSSYVNSNYTCFLFLLAFNGPGKTLDK